MAQPNEGLPKLVGNKTLQDMSPVDFAVGVLECRRAGARILDGCCGTPPADIKAIVEVQTQMATEETPLAPVFDETVLLTLLDGDRESAAEIVDEYVNGLEGQVSELRESIEAGDCTVMRERAHQLKGASASVGAEAMRYCAADLEQRAVAGNLTDQEKPELVAELDRHHKQLTDLIAEKGSLM